ncbi:hypothetical protein HB779_16330 [Phyllobacterium sp. 628]|uniref:hypothetical protein n=1 Tax=Phyllobacterium sp. 628 TaxID=2718938 RepID=UPI0016626E7A|nr:hypothetical protein [Phyllobacterium sp. 628]QND53284.1 hypothetical protein HB779_16330 [Phyllobacterium sp. 628]
MMAEAGTPKTATSENTGHKGCGYFRKNLAAFLATALLTCTLMIPGVSLANDDPAMIQMQSVTGDPLATFTQEQLKQAFPMVDMITETPWTNGVKIHFRGPSLKDMVAKYKIGDKTNLEVAAFDNYIIKITMEEVSEFAPIVALERACSDDEKKNGTCPKGQDYIPLSLDDGGPFYIVWPLAKLPKPYVPARNSIWVWFATSVRPAD